MVAAPNGTAYGDGSVLYPTTLEIALSGLYSTTSIQLRSGTYVGDFISNVAGAAQNPIEVRPYNMENVVIDGSLRINGSDTHWYNIEFVQTDNITRQSIFSGSTPSDLNVRWIDAWGMRTKIINCIVHDLLGNGIGLWGPAEDAEIYGCVIYYNGWDAPDRGHGHGIYTQNSLGTKIIRDNILFNGFELNIKIYTENGTIDRYIVDGNTCFGAASLVQLDGANTKYWNIFVGSINPAIAADNINIQNNLTYHTLIQQTNLLGYNGGITNSSVSDNVFAGFIALALTNESALAMSGNMFAGIISEFTEVEYPSNVYLPEGNFGNRVFIRPNQYQTGRANITIYNEAQLDSIQVNVRGVLDPGANYKLRNVQDYFADIQTGVVAPDGTINVDMQAANRSVATPVAWTAPATMFPEFGCFVLEAA